MRTWVKSSYSFANGNCIEAAGNWRKSSRSEAGNCAEVGQDGTGVLMRDSKDPGGPVLAFGAGAWTAFTVRLRSA